ncbi:hypothetical protein ACFSOZ_23850 [Mesorhizobium newzealandense]|uniref:Tyr recombinase domain-containing protein n=1 Tax=Mesorhizobium newzealandense TaxID=1300302 RepID=A0ABW4UHG1_9HYPH
MHLISAGVDVTVIRSWLGHVSLDTTNHYARANLETKRKALEKVAVPAIPGGQPSWKRDASVLAWLERQCDHGQASRSAQAWRRAACRSCPLPALRPQAHGAIHGRQAQHSALFLLAGPARQWRAALHRLRRAARRRCD